AAAERADKTLARLNPVQALAIAPTGVGFCMALSRGWLNKVPRLDTAFGKGYGEEVDWCQKVRIKGGKHVIAGNLFVAHHGGASFGEAKLARVIENNAVISRRYPTFDDEVSAFKTADPLVGPRLVAGLALIAQQGVVPIYLRHPHGGGATHWLDEQIEDHLARGESVVVLHDGDLSGHTLIELRTPIGMTSGNVLTTDLKHYLAVLPTRHLIYSCLVATREPLLFLGRLVDMLTHEDRFSIVLHDFFPLCPSYNLLNADGVFCNLPDPATCQSCYARLSGLTGKRPLTISGWRTAWTGFMARADEITAFSQDSRAQLLKVWPEFVAKVAVRPHLVKWQPGPILPAKTDRQVIGVLGDIGYSKGAAVLLALANLNDPRVRIVVIGTLNPAYAHRAITVHGAYNRDEIGRLAQRYGVTHWFIPAIWPETFSYTIHECLATGLPVFTFDLGAQGEVARKRANGHVLARSLSPTDLRDALLLQN
ncbi:MAG: glycosyltransferase, partial [Deltaproteobacteria bacterium]